MAKTFYDLKIWQKGYELLMRIYEVTSQYPSEGKYGLTQDTRRSANSTVANIAESHGRYYFADKSRILYIARGETEETRSHLKVAEGRGYISNKIFQEIDSEYEGLSKGINTYIRSLKNHQSSN